MKRIALFAATGLIALVVAISIAVQIEAEYVHDILSEEGAEAALVLYHPSRDAGFSDDLSLALAHGLAEAGLTVHRSTVTRQTPTRPDAYALIAVVSNTYYWTPDLPTLRFLRRAQLQGMSTLGLIGGAGSTARAERLLAEGLDGTGGDLIETRSFWLLRPNDESRLDEPNRKVALDQARALGRRVGARVAESGGR